MMHRVHFEQLDGDGDVSFCEHPPGSNERRSRNENGADQELEEQPNKDRRLQLNMTAEVEELLQYLNQFSFTRSSRNHANHSSPLQHHDAHANNHSVPSVIPLSPDESASSSSTPNQPTLDLSTIARAPTLQSSSSEMSQQGTMESNENYLQNLEANNRESKSALLPPSPDESADTHGSNHSDDSAAVAELYRQALAERAAARKWAADLRLAVAEWAKSVAVELRSHNASNHDDHSDRLAYYQNALSELQEQLNTEREEHRKIVLSLHEIIHHQQERLTQFEQRPDPAATDASMDEKEMERQQSVKPPATAKKTARQSFSPEQQATEPSSSVDRASAMVALPRQPPRLPALSLSPLSHDLISLDDNNASMEVPKLPRLPASARKAKPVTPFQDRSRKLTQDGNCQVITYGNGSVKEIYTSSAESPSSSSVRQEVIRYPNGDVQTTTKEDQAYYFASSGVIQVVFRNCRDSVQYHFPNGQVEEHWSNGCKLVWFPDGSVEQFEGDPDTDYHARDSSRTDEKGSGHRRPNLDQVEHSFACTV